ncbi:ricin-type beta-trefoil lectin domain protein [Actinoplanes sp. G11-F43]|uniref:ricin-type beta-trefoil lectin domain protein n=1 Tax=Actinoplanes sp. G11-F43 TaxID=3424130 RepID=UPI003D355EDC
MSPHRIFRDDRGSLPMAMLVVTIGLALSSMLLPVIVRQVTTTRTLVDRNTALNGAQIGLDVVMARVRAASYVDDNKEKTVRGQLEDMPACRITGDAGVAGTGEALRYIVDIEYRDQDGNTLSCPLSKVPTTALVTSRGLRGSAVISGGTGGTADLAGSRSLSATYVFSTNNTNIPGGSIRIASTTTAGGLCFDAGTKTPAAGTALTVQTCNGSTTQQFGYTGDLYLKLVNSETNDNDAGMCLYAGATHSTNNPLVFQKCADAEARTTTYQWSLDGNSLFHSTGSTSNIENLCINLRNPNTIGSAVILGSCSVSNPANVWRSDAGVGAGMAGAGTSQLVNYSQFSRCLDVTNQQPGSSYMIAWFCKQSPKGAVDWNQIWAQPSPPGVAGPENKSTGAITVTRSGTRYCLRTPDRGTASDAYVTTITCPANPASNPSLMWTVFGKTDKYETGFRILDRNGFCLQPTDLNATPKDTHTDGTSKIKVEKCGSSELQKWNAPANLSKLNPLTDVREN